MSKFNLLGIIFSLGGIVMVIFQAVSSMMTTEDITWKSKTLESVFGTETFSFIDNISIGFLQNLANTMISMPIFIILIAIGVLFFLLEILHKKI